MTQRLAFLEFYNTTLFGGVHTFSWVHPLDETQPVQMKFLSNPRVRLIGSLQYVLRWNFKCRWSNRRSLWKLANRA